MVIATDKFILKIDGVEIDAKNILSLVFKDSAGVKSDTVTLKVVPHFHRPAVSASIELIFQSFLGDKLNVELNCGLFHVQTVTRTNNKALAISATGVEFSAKQKTKLSTAYKDTKLSKIIDIVAKRLGHTLNYKTTDHAITSLLQTNETDINFLERLAKDYNVTFSIKNNIIYFVNKDEDSLPNVNIDISTCSTSTLKHTSKKHYSSCIASWHIIDTAESTSITVGEGEPAYEMHGSFKDAKEATVKAKAKLLDLNKGTIQGSFSSRPVAVYAGTKVNLTNTYKNENDGIYSVKSCTHTWANGKSWTVSAEIEN